MAIEIGAIGYNYSHDKTFFMDKPEGPGAFLCLLIKSSAFFRINNKNYNVNKESFIILRPSTPCFYRANKELYIDDWFFFWMNEDDEKYLLSNGIILDEPVFIRSTEELSQIIHSISFEHYSSNPFSKELKSKYTEIFFLKLARIIASKEFTSTDVLSSKNDKLTYLKSLIFEYPDSFKNINEMADYMNLSRSGFQHMYSKVFGHSVIQDVIAGRIQKAKNLLETTTLTISEISNKCGYKTEFHFMRQFKEQTNLTPTEYRNSSSWNKNSAEQT